MAEMEGKSCESCGMPLTKPEEHGAKDPNNPYCLYCADEQGKLKPREEILEGFKSWITEQAKTEDGAKMIAEWLMSYQPAWKS